MWYAVCGAIGSELVFRLIVMWKSRLSDADDEVNEVLWTNDLTQVCRESHKTKVAPCNTPYCFIRNMNRVVEIIDNAQHTIDLSMYIFTMVDIAESFFRAHKRGVKIRIICDESMVYSSGSQIMDLNKVGIPVRFQTSASMLMHHKFCICDGHTNLDIFKMSKKKTIPILITGSANWTFQGFASNWDNLIVTSNRVLVKEFESEFERTWELFNNNKNWSCDSDPQDTTA